MAKVKMTGRILSQEKIATEIYSMWIEAAEIVKKRSRDSLFLCIAGTIPEFCQDLSVFVRLTERREHCALYTELQERAPMNFPV